VVTLETLPDLIEQVCVAVVDVRVSGGHGAGNGSGFAIGPAAGDKDAGVIVTNAHVVAGGDTYTVRFHDGSEHEADVRLETRAPTSRSSASPPSCPPSSPCGRSRRFESASP
jgi:S1-C subfamily serine protease